MNQLPRDQRDNEPLRRARSEWPRGRPSSKATDPSRRGPEDSVSAKLSSCLSLAFTRNTSHLLIKSHRKLETGLTGQTFLRMPFFSSLRATDRKPQVRSLCQIRGQEIFADAEVPRCCLLSVFFFFFNFLIIRGTWLSRGSLLP